MASSEAPPKYTGIGVGRADRRPAALHPVEVALVVERRLRLPLLAHHGQEVVGARVAGGLVGEVAVALLVDVVAAGDHVHRHPARVEGVEGGVRARGQRRREEPRAVRQQHAEPLGPAQDLVGHHEPVRHGRGVGDQHPVEAGALVGPGERLDVVRVDDGPDGRARLGLRRDAVDLVGPVVSLTSWVAAIPMNSMSVMRARPSSLDRCAPLVGDVAGGGAVGLAGDRPQRGLLRCRPRGRSGTARRRRRPWRPTRRRPAGS